MDVQVVVPFRERCGINDYAALLAAHLPGTARLRHTLNPAHPACDILHVQFEPTLFRQGGQSCLPVLKKCRARARVVTVHEVYEINPFVAPMPEGNGPLNALRRLKYRLSHRLVLREDTFAARNFFVDAVIVHTNFARRILLQRGASGECIHVLPHPVFPLPPGDSSDPSAVDGKKTILVFGFLSPANDYAMLLKAFARVRDRARLIIAGAARRMEDRDLEETLTREIEKQGLSREVERIGYVEPNGLAALFNRADLFVSPAVIKCGSGTLARALGAGLPAVAPDLPYVQEINAEVPGCVAAYRAGDSVALAACLETLLEPDAACAARERVRTYAEKHSLAAFAKAHAQLYGRLLEGPC
ncbi:MAG: glycosyltransferase family 4 protein [Fibrobacterota bacterium]